MKNNKKNIIYTIILITVIIITIRTIYGENSLDIILSNLKNFRISYGLICILFLTAYFVIQGIYMKLIFRALKYRLPLKKGVFYSLVEFYFSGITPSSTGGQPMQLYYMAKDKIPIRKSYIVLVLNTIYFKTIIFILSFIVFINNLDYILTCSPIYLFFFILGFIVDLVIIVLAYFLLFKPKLIKKVLNVMLKVGNKFKFLKQRLANIEIDEVLLKYKDELNFIKNNKKTVFVTFVLTFIQRLLMFSIIYIVYRGLGFNEYNYFDILAIQIIMQTVVEAYPLPGGAGISEGILHTLFKNLHGVIFAGSLMILTRTFAFYLPLLVSGLIILIHSILKRRKTNIV